MNSIHKEIIDHYHSEAHTTIYKSISKKNEKIRESLSEVRLTRIYNEIYQTTLDLYNTVVNSIYKRFKNVSDE